LQIIWISSWNAGCIDFTDEVKMVFWQIYSRLLDKVNQIMRFDWDGLGYFGNMSFE